MVSSAPKSLDQSCFVVAEEICHLMVDAYSVEAQLLGATNFPPLRDALERRLSNNNIFIGIRDQGVLIAATEIEAGGDNSQLIASLVVKPDMFRLGLGESLLRYVVTCYSARCISVCTDRRNMAALALYAKVGFKQSSQWMTADGFEMVTLRYEQTCN